MAMTARIPSETFALRWAETETPTGRLGKLLRSWEGTPYVLGSQAAGQRGGVDCVRFVCAVLDALYRRRTPIEQLPQDRALHDRKGALGAMRAIRRLYMPNEVVRGVEILPGDVFVWGPEGGGPGHAMIAGTGGLVWHCPGPKRRVVPTGLAPLHGHELFRIYRAPEERRIEW